MRKVLIVGGGFGGMATAIRFREAGCDVDLVDVDPNWRPYGAGITITGPTLRAYRHLGLIEDIRRGGAITSGSKIFRFDGQFLRALDEPPLEEGLPATGGIMRPVLHQLMQRKLEAVGGAKVRLGVTVDALKDSAGGVEVRFSDGEQGSYDLVVGADGIFSRVRKLRFPHMSPTQFTGQGCWRIVTPTPPGLDQGEFYLGHRNPAGITPCGENQVYLWVLTEDPNHDYIPESEQHERLRAHLADFGGSVGWMRDHMSADTWINYRPLEAGLQPRPWYDGRVVLLGDACHATTPHLASGAGMAVESAIVLVEELLRPGRTVQEGLAAYEERRFDRCKFVVETSIGVGQMQLAGAGPEAVGARLGAGLHRLAEPF